MTDQAQPTPPTGSDTQTDNQKLSFGQRAVGLSFNPSGNKEVQTLKQQIAYFIDTCDQFRTAATDPEVKRMYSVAITEAQTAQMWGVKAATWQS